MTAEETSTISSEPPKRGAWARYRTEWRERTTNILLQHRDTKEFQEFLEEETQNEPIEPVFELLTTYTTRGLAASGTSDGTGEPTLVTTVSSKPTYQLKIYSQTIANALQSVVKYYPSQNLEGDPIVVHWPYPVLVHHYDELAAFRDAAANKDPANRCIMEHDAPEHISLLLRFLDDQIMDEVRAEQERNKRGVFTWEYMWVAFKPGITVMEKYAGEEEFSVRVVQSVRGGTLEPDGPVPWEITGWGMEYNGRELGRVSLTMANPKFDGESIANWGYWLDPLDFDEDRLEHLPEPAKERIEQGKIWFNLLQKKCKNYKGKTKTFPYNEVDGLVMVDMKGYYTDSRLTLPPGLMDATDCRRDYADGSCAFCKGNPKRGNSSEVKANKNVVALFDDFNRLFIEDFDELTPQQYLLCPTTIRGFVFKTRKWELLHVSNFSEPEFDEGMINGLVMDEGRKKTIMSLAKSFARRNKHGEEMTKTMWSADFVRGKGSGLIFLLHGRPGVGKTCTAECIAAFTRRPLMVLTSSDIGTEPSVVETNLTNMFKTAMSWDAVLLIDEADVFMERRTTADLERNSLVAGFLRALEFYDGILFLTTNRVGAFDDAFISRVHLQLYFPEFTDEQRQLVWKTFTDKLARERGNYIRLNIDAKEYIRGAEMRAVEWNGREIRNALQTAVALAEYDAEKDEEGKILVTDTHLKAVVELSSDFKNYLNELHRGSEAKRAERRYERLDGNR